MLINIKKLQNQQIHNPDQGLPIPRNIYKPHRLSHLIHSYNKSHEFLENMKGNASIQGYSSGRLAAAYYILKLAPSAFSHETKSLLTFPYLAKAHSMHNKSML